MRASQIIQSLAAVALLAIPATAMAAPDQNSQNQNQNRCGYTNSNGQWVATACNGQNGQNNGQWNNGQGQWNNGQNQNGRHRHRNRDENDNNGNNNNDERDNNDNRNRNGNGQYGNNGGYNNGGYSNGQWNNGRGNRNAPIVGSVSSFTPYNLYLSNGTHVTLHNGTIIRPTGTNLVPGLRVRVIGSYNADGTYSANEIDATNANRYQR